MVKGPVLFACVENVGRSQMVGAFARNFGLNAGDARRKSRRGDRMFYLGGVSEAYGR